MTHEDEHEIIKKISGGNEEYFEKIVNQYKNKIYNFSLNILYNKEDAQEVTLEVFYRFHKGFKKFKGECKISTYLYQIAKNLCKDFLKKKKIKTANIEEVANLIRTGDDPEQIYLKNEEKKEILFALGNLKNGYREALILRELEGFSYKEISEILKQNLNTVKTKVKRAREQILSQIRHLTGE